MKLKLKASIRTAAEEWHEKYDKVWPFINGLARVKLNDKWGYVDNEGNEVVPLMYDFAGFFYEGLARVELKRKCGFVDKTGKEVIPPKYDDVAIFWEGLAPVWLNGKGGFVDVTGKEYWNMTKEEARKQMKS